ncbi:MAG: heme-binding protein [Woeseiaceae bacterium]|nr:heme-binding protein [Woeseiaceae bacterium]
MTAKVAFVLFLLVSGAAMAAEEPKYQSLARTESYEVRRYIPYLVAEVDVAGKARDRQGFRALAGFIFGDNDGGKKMQMTVPVQSRAAAADDASTYAFVMESKYRMETLPRPNNPNVRIRETLERIVAVRRFSGRWTRGAIAAHEQALLRDLANDGIKTTGPVELARYNGPMTPWFLRRNEVMVPIRWTVQ